ncbi:MAG TPA: polysaccharide deacetylase family protein [Micromonosporaceae bacterium]|nr:polysaccharide deacetylase family protein [Micromonosporaceae bacterium]
MSTSTAAGAGASTTEPTPEPRVMRRRRILTQAAAVVLGAGAATGVGVAREAMAANRPLPFYGGYAATIKPDRKTPPQSPNVNVTWSVATTKKLIALTFDDGPHPKWTPQVLSILDQTRTSATFFMTGVNARDYGKLVAGRLGRHEVGNHTWKHVDLARQTFEESYDAIGRAHWQLTELWGREPTLLRPPYGHIAGSSLLAANEFGYQIVLWNRQMIESEYRSNPQGLVDYVVGACTPGTILLAHDTGPQDRLVAISGLAQMIRGLRGRGFEFVTVSELLAEQDAEDSHRLG